MPCKCSKLYKDNLELDKTTTKRSEISRAFQKHVDHIYIHMVNNEFKMLENILCTLVYGLGEKLLGMRQNLMSLLIRLWDREPTSLSSHVLTSFYIKFSFIHFSYVKVT
jgi:hypothetical protein